MNENTQDNPFAPLMDANEAARQLNVGMPWIRRLIYRGELDAQRFGRTWVLTRASVRAYQAKQQKED